MSFDARLQRLEGHVPSGCATCRTWTHRLETDAEESPYAVAQRQLEPPGPRDWPATCPDCGRELLVIRVVHSEQPRTARNGLDTYLFRDADAADTPR